MDTERDRILCRKLFQLRDLKKTSMISQMCHESDEPIFVTKNGYGDMVIMSMKTYEKKMFRSDVYHKLDAGWGTIERGNKRSARTGL